MKVNGEMIYLWRAVDHEGEILESYVTRKRDKQAALAFMKKALRHHGSPERSPPTDFAPMAPRWMNSEIEENRKSAVGRITGLKTATCRSADENGRCCGSGWFHCRGE